MACHFVVEAVLKSGDDRQSLSLAVKTSLTFISSCVKTIMKRKVEKGGSSNVVYMVTRKI